MKDIIKDWTKILVIIIIIYIILSSVFTSLNGGDFDIYLDAARKLRLNMDPYAPPYLIDLGYSYSPFFAILLIPFSYNFFVSEVLWCILSYLLLYRTFILVKSYFDFREWTNYQYYWWSFLLLFLSFQFILYNIDLIQITFLILWAIFESINYIHKGKHVLGGIILGVVINIKIMPIIILGYLFYRGYFKAFGVSILTSVILLFFPTLFYGFDYNMFLLSRWWSVINPANPEHLLEAGIGPHSMTAFVPVFITQTIGDLNINRNIFNLSYNTTILITYIVRLLLIALSLVYLKSIPFIKEKSNLKTYWELSYFTMLIPLVLPHQQKYGFLLTLPMVGYMLYYFFTIDSLNRLKQFRIPLSLFIIAMLFYSPLYGSELWGKEIFKLSQHYRLLTFATLILIGVSMYCNPAKLVCKKIVVKPRSKPISEQSLN